MLTKSSFTALLAEHNNLLLIDGALATELEHRGHDLNTPLWSGHLLQNSPQAIQELHKDYYTSGAQIAITASYQTVPSNLQQHLGISSQAASDLIKLSAQLARSPPGRPENVIRLVAGSVGPYGAYLADGSEYSGAYSLSSTEYKTFHRPRIQALIDGGVDLLAVETIPKLEEVEAVLELLEQEFRGAVCWISCTVKDDGRVLSDGTEIARVLDVVQKHRSCVLAFGVNCVGIETVSPFLRNAKERWSEKGVTDDLPLLCYPNSGEVYDGESKTWSGVDSRSKRLCDMVDEWRSLGACLIGGCCRTGPDDIRRIAEAVKRVDSSKN